MAGYVYIFDACTGQLPSRYKLGYTADMSSRLASYRTSHPAGEVCLLYKSPVARDIETAVKAHFSGVRVTTATGRESEWIISPLEDLIITVMNEAKKLAPSVSSSSIERVVKDPISDLREWLRLFGREWYGDDYELRCLIQKALGQQIFDKRCSDCQGACHCVKKRKYDHLRFNFDARDRPSKIHNRSVSDIFVPLFSPYRLVTFSGKGGMWCYLVSESDYRNQEHYEDVNDHPMTEYPYEEYIGDLSGKGTVDIIATALRDIYYDPTIEGNIFSYESNEYDY